MKITLLGSKPPVWRRFLVDNNITFHELHNIIQEIMGWSNYHLYQFTINGLSILVPNEDYDDEYEDSQKVRLKDFLNTEKQKFSYLYDFGDNWKHILVVEKFISSASADKYPICVDGKMACPPEDCGGIYGFEDFIKIMRNKKHPDHKEMLDWLGERFDPKQFDKNVVNKRLRRRQR
jgi:hypothetical protein